MESLKNLFRSNHYYDSNNIDSFLNKNRKTLNRADVNGKKLGAALVNIADKILGGKDISDQPITISENTLLENAKSLSEIQAELLKAPKGTVPEQVQQLSHLLERRLMEKNPTLRAASADMGLKEFFAENEGDIKKLASSKADSPSHQLHSMLADFNNKAIYSFVGQKDDKLAQFTELKQKIDAEKNLPPFMKELLSKTEEFIQAMPNQQPPAPSSSGPSKASGGAPASKATEPATATMQARVRLINGKQTFNISFSGKTTVADFKKAVLARVEVNELKQGEVVIHEKKIEDGDFEKTLECYCKENNIDLKNISPFVTPKLETTLQARLAAAAPSPQPQQSRKATAPPEQTTVETTGNYHTIGENTIKVRVLAFAGKINGKYDFSFDKNDKLSKFRNDIIEKFAGKENDKYNVVVNNKILTDSDDQKTIEQYCKAQGIDLRNIKPFLLEKR